MATSSCSYWWHCPVYVAMSITLAAISISSVKHSSNLSPSLSANASLALESHNFTSILSLLRTNPQLFLSSPQLTFFAFKDDPLLNLSSDPGFLKELLEYHYVPFKIPFKELKKYTVGTCFKTLNGNKKIGVTNIENWKVEINNVTVSHPDLFLEGGVVIHGVSGPFSKSAEITELPLCVFHDKNDTGVEWRNVIRFLSSSGYVPFGVGLNSVLEGIIQENTNLVSVTVFAPVDFGFVSSSWGLLSKIVRYHIVPGRFVYADLASFPNKSALKTLHSDRKLVINVNNAGMDQKLWIDGVEIIAPNAFLSNKFVIHGISRAFRPEELPSTSL